MEEVTQRIVAPIATPFFAGEWHAAVFAFACGMGSMWLIIAAWGNPCS